MARPVASSGHHSARPRRLALPGPLRPPPSGVLPHSPSLRGPPEAREAQAGSEAQQCTSRDARPEMRRPAVRRCRSRRVGGAREVRARWPPPARPLGPAAEPAEGRGSPPSKSLMRWMRLHACRLELLTPKGKRLLFRVWFDFHALFSQTTMFLLIFFFFFWWWGMFPWNKLAYKFFFHVK